MRYLGLSASAPQKVARFLLDLVSAKVQEIGRPRFTLTLTHREIAEVIGTSRETVTRLFARFKCSGWLEIRGSTLILTDRFALEKLRDL